MPTIIAPSAHFTEGFNQSATTFDGANEALDISDALDTLDPYEYPLLSLIGRDSLRDACTQVKHEWLEDELRGMSATTTDTDLNNTSTGDVTLTLATAGDYLKFRGAAVGTGPCDIVRIWSTAGSEVAPVIATANNTINVTRGYFGDTPVDHTGYTKTIEIIGVFQPQGKSTVGTQRTTIKATVYNYTQIFEDSYSANATQQATGKIVKGNERARQMERILKLFGLQFERTLLYSRKKAVAVGTNGGTMDGIIPRLSTNVYNKSGAILQESHLWDALRAVWEADGEKSVYGVVQADQMKRVGQLLDPYRQVGYSDKVFGTWVTSYVTPFGRINFLLDKNMRTDGVLLIDSSRIGFGPLSGRALGMSKIAATSREVDQWQWTGEYTSETRQEKAHAFIYGLATTGF